MSDTDLLNRFDREMMPGIKSSFESVKDEWGRAPIASARKCTKIFLSVAVLKLNNLLGIAFNNLDNQTKSLVIVSLIRGLNSVLPIDHPYLFCILAIKSENYSWHLSVIYRRDIPGAHDLTDCGIFVIIHLETREELKNEHFKFVDTHFFGSDEWDPSMLRPPAS